MRKAHMEKLYEAGCPVVVHVPKAKRLEPGDARKTPVPEFVQGMISSITPGESKGRQSVVRVCFGLGQEIEVLSRSVLRMVTQGDSRGSCNMLRRTVTRTRPKKKDVEQFEIGAVECR